MWVDSKNGRRAKNWNLSIPVTPSQIEHCWIVLIVAHSRAFPNGMYINPLCDRIVHAFFAYSTDDRINFRVFMELLGHYHSSTASTAARRNWNVSTLLLQHPPLPFTIPIPFVCCILAFRIYDLDDVESMSRDELLHIIDKHRRAHYHGSGPMSF